jgi:hypothetical protein
MKLISKILLFILIVISTPLSSYEFFNNSWMNYIKVKDVEPIEVKNVQRVPQEIVLGMIQVESNGNDDAYNESEDAVGCLQIRPIMVREVNRILKMKGEEYRFKMKDRWDREKSLEMFWIWRDYHHPDSDYEIIARNWNGGPNGYKKKSTERYWEKVNRCLGER